MNDFAIMDHLFSLYFRRRPTTSSIDTSNRHFLSSVAAISKNDSGNITTPEIGSVEEDVMNADSK
jgi:hypothetical protein